MKKSILFSLLHDVWGESSNDSMRLAMMRLTANELADKNAKQLSEKVPEIPVAKWENWCAYYSAERYKLRENLLQDLGIDLLLYIDDTYPEVLKEVYRPPGILYVKGNFSLANLNIGMVGSRRATAYGKNVAYSLSKKLSDEGVRIISGLAKGIDANAHKGAIEGLGGTVAVLGCGIDRIYPRENARLYEEILSHPNSSIISEWPLEAAAVDWHFPARNRIIVGLSEGVCVVEAAKKSGSLISANYALEYGKEVFAVPGLITSQQSVGCHRLLKDGAKLVAQPSDILDEFGQMMLFKDVKTDSIERQLTAEQQKVYTALSSIPQSVEEICTSANLPIHVVNGILLEFELDDLVSQDYGRQYSRKEI